MPFQISIQSLLAFIIYRPHACRSSVWKTLLYDREAASSAAEGAPPAAAPGRRHSPGRAARVPSAGPGAAAGSRDPALPGRSRKRARSCSGPPSRTHPQGSGGGSGPARAPRPRGSPDPQPARAAGRPGRGGPLPRLTFPVLLAQPPVDALHHPRQLLLLQLALLLRGRRRGGGGGPAGPGPGLRSGLHGVPAARRAPPGPGGGALRAGAAPGGHARTRPRRAARRDMESARPPLWGGICPTQLPSPPSGAGRSAMLSKTARRRTRQVSGAVRIPLLRGTPIQPSRETPVREPAGSSPNAGWQNPFPTCKRPCGKKLNFQHTRANLGGLVPVLWARALEELRFVRPFHALMELPGPFLCISQFLAFIWVETQGRSRSSTCSQQKCPLKHFCVQLPVPGLRRFPNPQILQFSLLVIVGNGIDKTIPFEFMAGKSAVELLLRRGEKSLIVFSEDVKKH